eukprot:6377976-Lingulodinium_polyedra.AAC.1
MTCRVAKRMAWAHHVSHHLHYCTCLSGKNPQSVAQRAAPSDGGVWTRARATCMCSTVRRVPAWRVQRARA